MTIKTISVTHGRTYNLGNFNSLKLDMSYGVDVEEGEAPEDVVRTLQEHAARHVSQEHERLLKFMI
jgi:hypothetical protein